MQLALDAADRLVAHLLARRGPVSAAEGARVLFALERAPEALARSLLDDVVRSDGRLTWLGSRVALTEHPGLDTAIEDAEIVVVDLETTGLSARRDRICEIGAARVRALAIVDTFDTLVDPGAPLPLAVTALTGIHAPDLRGAPRAGVAVGRFLAFAGNASLAAHNARFDLAFLDREVDLLTGRRLLAPVVDTVSLARRLLAGRSARFSLAQLARFFGTAARPCHRALPDALATAEILVALLGLAQERGARCLADVLELSAPRARRLHAKRALVAGAPTRPGVYLFRDRNETVLYVGEARDLRARLRSYFSSGRQRPAVEAALGALARVEWRELGSELEAVLEELRLLRELRPPANARGGRPDRSVYLAARDGRWRVVTEPGPFGPLASRRRAELATRALAGFDGGDPAEAIPQVRAKLRRLAREQRFEDAARVRDRLAALEEAVERVAGLRKLRGLAVCLLAPDRRPGFRKAFFVARGRVAAIRSLPPGPADRLEIASGLAEAEASVLSHAPEHAEDLLAVARFLRRPGPELRIVSLADLRGMVEGSALAPGRREAA